MPDCVAIFGRLILSKKDYENKVNRIIHYSGNYGNTSQIANSKREI